MFDTNRRRVLQGAGALSGLALAGCTGNEPQVEEEPEQTAPQQTEPTPDVDRVAADPTDIPDPIDRDEPAEIDVTLRTEEVTAEVEDGVTFTYMAYNGQVPGPMIRARRGDTIDLTVENPEDSDLPHNVDFHACYGPGGGAEATTVAPGETEHLRFQVKYPGAFIYHCAVPNLDMHISMGGFGMILVEPKEGLPEVDQEIYLGQHELYTDKDVGEEGHHSFDMEAMAAEDPTYVVLNGEAYGLTPDGYGHAAEVETGDTARVYLVTGGPNVTSNFHPIGNVWTDLWAEGAIASDPERFVQTKPVAPGSCVIATMDFPVPGTVKLVDHALSRVARKGCLATIGVEGEEDPDVFDPDPK